MKKQPTVGFIEFISIANIFIVLLALSTVVVYNLQISSGPFNAYGQSLLGGFILLPAFMILFIPSMAVAYAGIRSAGAIKNTKLANMRRLVCWTSVALSAVMICVTLTVMHVFDPIYKS